MQNALGRSHHKAKWIRMHSAKYDGAFLFTHINIIVMMKLYSQGKEHKLDISSYNVLHLNKIVSKSYSLICMQF